MDLCVFVPVALRLFSICQKSAGVFHVNQSCGQPASVALCEKTLYDFEPETWLACESEKMA